MRRTGGRFENRGRDSVTNSPQEPTSEPAGDQGAEPAIPGAGAAPGADAGSGTGTAGPSAGATEPSAGTAGPSAGATGPGAGAVGLGVGAAGFPPPQLPAYPAQPGWGYQPPPPSTGKRTALVAGVIGLVAGIGIGVAGFAIATSDSTSSSSDAGSTSRPAIVTTTTTTSSTEAVVEGDYSMDSVTNACDLIDPTPMTKWASTPDGPPKHYETPSVSLRCDVPYSTLSIDQVHYNQSGITFEAEFTQGGADPAYDGWKERDTATTAACGDVTGIGAEAYWCKDQADTSDTRVSYVVAVQDSNISAYVRLAVSLAEGEPPISWDELDSIARTQLQKAMDGLRT